MDTRGNAAFVGRQHELAELERVLAQIKAGQGATVLLAGDAGIGKTRLAAQLAIRARGQGFEVLIGHAIDFAGTELPYQPFVEALRPLGPPPPVDALAAGSQLGAFEATLGILADRAAVAPLLIMLEDLHWGDTSTLDLVAFLAHNLGDRRVLLLATIRRNEQSARERVRRLTAGIMRAASAFILELGPLRHGDLAALLAARTSDLSSARTNAIIARSEGNPFFAEELLVAGGRDDELPSGLRDVLLRHVNQLDRTTQDVLRLAATAGNDVPYPLLRAVAALPERDLRDCLRQAVEHGVLAAQQATGCFRFRHALLAEATYSTILPGEREELHGRLAEELSRSGAASPAEIAPHWAAAGRRVEALVASVEAARQAEVAFGLAEALAHLERAYALWDSVPDAADLARLDLVDLLSWAARLASQTGAGPRAVELARAGIALVGDSDRTMNLYIALGEFLFETGHEDEGLAALRRAVESAQEQKPSATLAYALGSLAGGLMVTRRHQESLPISRQALDLARRVDARDAEVRALTVLGANLAYLGNGEEGLGHLHHALQIAGDIGDRWGLDRAYVNLTDALTLMGRPAESAQLGQVGLEVLRRNGIDRALLAANTTEALLAIGEWDEAERVSAAALRGINASFSHHLVLQRADLELGRGDFDAARAYLRAAFTTLGEDHGRGIREILTAELALWERRWLDADRAVQEGLAPSLSGRAANLRVWFCAKGLRAQAELTALARARRDADEVRSWLQRAGDFIGGARAAAAEAAAMTPWASSWLAVAEAEYARTGTIARPELWSAAAVAWNKLHCPPIAAYCHWRHAEALVAAGASRTEANTALREAHAVAVRIGARPLSREVELLAVRARLDLVPEGRESTKGLPGPDGLFGLTPREAEVLELVAGGLTNREIAAALVISEKTISIHVSHILQKLDAPNRRAAAAIAHRAAAPEVRG